MGVLALAALALVQRPEPACAQGPELSGGPVEIVLDASGTMRGLLGDAEAMAVAKDFVRTLRAELAAGGTPPPLGLRVYGAGSPSPQRDCRDTRLAARAGDAGADLVALVSAVQPLAQSFNSPSESKSVRLAVADALRHYRDPTVTRALIATLNGKDFGVAWQARQSLRMITGRDFRYNERAWSDHVAMTTTKPLG